VFWHVLRSSKTNAHDATHTQGLLSFGRWEIAYVEVTRHVIEGDAAARLLRSIAFRAMAGSNSNNRAIPVTASDRFIGQNHVFQESLVTTVIFWKKGTATN